MELNIRGRNLEITDQIRSHVAEKLGHLERHLPAVALVTVELSSESTRAQRHRVVAQVTLKLLAVEFEGQWLTAINSTARC